MGRADIRGLIGALVFMASVARAGVFTIEQVATDVGLPSDTGARLRRGEMVRSTPDESSDRELGVDLTFLVQQPLGEVVKAFRAVIDLKSDPQVAASIPILDRGTLADFDGLVLDPDGAAEAKRYLAASPGETLNLSQDEIRAFKTLVAAGTAPTQPVEDQLKRMLLARYQAYVRRGLGGIAPYERGGGPFEPAGELRRASAAAHLLQRYAPALQQQLLSYPDAKPPGLEEQFYWLRCDLDGRPNFTLRHRMAMPVGDIFATADREFYVSHGYNTSQAFAGLVPVPEGTLVVFRSRVSTDQVGGFGSSVKKGIGRDVMAKQMTEIFERSRNSFRR